MGNWFGNYMDIGNLDHHSLDVREFMEAPFEIGIYDFGQKMLKHIQNNPKIKCTLNLETSIIAASKMSQRFIDPRFPEDDDFKEWKIRLNETRKLDIEQFNRGMMLAICLAVAWWNDTIHSNKLDELIFTKKEAMKRLNEITEYDEAIIYSKDKRFMTLNYIETYIVIDDNTCILIPIPKSFSELT